ncbi:PREDICTED: LOW QUALITY PROTEIN: mitochondrial fission regulator 1-like [Branchiostoma belcheri]|uniref:LOW QUALITY PROTEIN: mitochondrial fission regulator 1-like n=1 Tax=Branchiostoma belcheri TaxID=7741 RepID=A0A6P4YE58_BRABE|nr:PREDICTED: LOW QUALITY PROTEIN: mitochondrial fission regulator 1-like [Branchiostoma belcheri]
MDVDHSLSSQLLIHILNHLLPYVMVAHQHLCTLWVSWWPKSAQRKVSHRSIVRLIGTYLSLKPQHHRLYFQTVQPDLRCSTPFSEDGVRRAPVSLADIAMLEQEEPLPGIYISCEVGQSRREETAGRVSSSCVKRKQTEDVLDASPAETCNPTSQQEGPVEDAALQRISALEAELNKLRAQIALMATMQPQAPPVQQGNPPGTPLQASPPAPPPPPPPPPPPASLATPVMNIKDIIKKNKSKRSGSANTPVAMPSPAVPNMMAVLKDMSNVKLRSVERSPGGTPIRQKPKESDAQDPAALIAQALRRKFAHRKQIGSPDQLDKENDWPSPETSGSPKFGRSLLKPVNRRRSSHSNSRSRLHSAPSAVQV